MAEITPDVQTARVWDYIKGFHAVHLVNVGLELGLFAKLDEAPDGLGPDALAKALGLHEPYLAVWCKTAYAYEILEATEDGAFRLAPFFDLLLVRRGNARYLAPYFNAAIAHFGPDMVRYPEFFRTGATYTYQEHGEDFSRAVAELTDGFHTLVTRRLLPGVPGLEDKLNAGARVLDMGCGAAGLLIKIAQAFPECTGVGVDVDAHGVAAAQENIARAGLGERIRAEHLDGGEIGHQDAFDLVTLIEVLHELPVAVRPRVLANCHKALKQGGLLFILDETYPSSLSDLRRPEYAFAVQTGFNELVWGNVVPTREEQEALLGGAGFGEVQRTPLGGLFTLLTARKG